MLRKLLVAGAVVGLAACSPAKEDKAPDIASRASPDAKATAAASAASPAEGRSIKKETDTYLFEYSYPAEAAAIPALRRHFEDDARRVEASLAQEAQRDQGRAEADGTPFRQRAHGEDWSVVADLPHWLSLSGKIYFYSGGAHPNSGSASIVWDKRRNRPLDGIDFFRSSAALDGAIGDRLCEMLDREREKRRGQPVDPAGGGMFSSCVPVEEATILLGSSNGRRFDRIGILMDPYVAGPYAEGSYEFTLPVTTSILDAVKEQYREAFALRR